MVDITWIGAGSAAFGSKLIGDVLTFLELRDETTVTLMDVDEARLRGSREFAEALVESEGADTEIETTTDRREALDGADYVIPTIWVGGLEPFENERLVPEKYGLDTATGARSAPAACSARSASFPR